MTAIKPFDAQRETIVVTLFICTACGTQFAERTCAKSARETPPESCPTCTDERQYVPRGGQRWTTLEALQSDHRNYFHRLAPGMYGVGTTPAFAIDERALLVAPGARTGAREPMVMWDCITLLDDATIDIIRALGGLAAIAISHPHYYTTMVEWARAFDCPLFLHADDREWVARPDPAITFWEGETRSLADVGAEGMTLIRCGGHFAGGTVMHWAGGAEGRGALLTGDVLQVSSDLASVSIMRSYPNNIPVSAAAVRRARDAIAPYAFDALYGAFLNRQIERDAKGAVERSLARLVERLEGISGPDAPLRGR
ncbi:MAG: MBL fold metallo-hydrolase [Gemmatimonadaceae bacterium]